jgi:hypothetical protein
MKRQPPSRRGDSIEDAVTGQFHRDKDTVDDAISQDFGAEGNETTIGVPEGVDLRRDAFEAAPTSKPRPPSSSSACPSSQTNGRTPMPSPFRTNPCR